MRVSVLGSSTSKNAVKANIKIISLTVIAGEDNKTENNPDFLR